MASSNFLINWPHFHTFKKQFNIQTVRLLVLHPPQYPGHSTWHPIRSLWTNQLSLALSAPFHHKKYPDDTIYWAGVYI
jgi:hypothetical protein